MFPGTKILTTAAKTLSAILHPALVPMWLMLALMCRGALLPGVGAQARGYFLFMVILNTVAVPMTCVLLIDRVGLWRKNSRGKLLRRILPIAVMLICYVACLMMIHDVPLVYPVRKMLVAGIGCLAFGIGTAFFMRVSMHMAAQGAALAYLGVAMLSVEGGMMMLLYGAIALAALLASARLWLDVETPRQSFLGFTGGFVVSLLVLLWT